jgi:hypothetical protein
LKSSEKAMPEITDVKVEALAKALCEKDGLLWEAEARSRQTGADMSGRISDDTDKAAYQARARQQLYQERGDTD